MNNSTFKSSGVFIDLQFHSISRYRFFNSLWIDMGNVIELYLNVILTVFNVIMGISSRKSNTEKVLSAFHYYHYKSLLILIKFLF